MLFDLQGLPPSLTDRSANGKKNAWLRLTCLEYRMYVHGHGSLPDVCPCPDYMCVEARIAVQAKI